MSIHFGSWRGCCSGFILHCKLPSFFLYTLMLIIHAWFKRFVRAWRAPPLAEESAYVSFGHVPNLYSMASPVTFFLVPGPRPKTSVHTHTHAYIHTRIQSFVHFVHFLIISRPAPPCIAARQYFLLSCISYDQQQLRAPMIKEAQWMLECVCAAELMCAMETSSSATSE